MTFWNLKNDAEIPEDGVLDIDGEIVAEPGWFTGPDACVASDFRKALKGVKNVTVHINSPGGDVIAGAEIYSALREHSLNGEGTVTVIVTYEPNRYKVSFDYAYGDYADAKLDAADTKWVEFGNVYSFSNIRA